MKRKYWMMHYIGWSGVVDGGIFDCPYDDIRAVAHCWQMSITDFNEFVKLIDEN